MHFIDQLMPPEDAVAGSADPFELKERLRALFSRYGEVCRLDLVRADLGPSRRVMCFLRMGTPEEEHTVVQALGMGRFGGDLVMVLALDEPHPQPDAPLWWMPAAGASTPTPRGLG